MFNNLIKLSSGRTTTKILATLLVITLTFANFALLGTFMFESIAIDSALAEQDNSTNCENVKFDAYLDLTDTTVREVSKDINAEDLVLHVAVSVEGNGRLEKGIIDFSESNFNSKENEKILTKEIDTISAGNKIVIDLPIVSRKDSNFNLSLLNMISKIKLTGQYIDENGNITDIDATKEVKVNWTTNEFTEEQVNLSGEVITNKIYEIDGANKRVLQVLVKANVQDNKLPVESTEIQIENPIEGVTPEKVRVTTFNTSATNGGTTLEFNNQQKSSWEYKEDENKTYIELTNIVSENGMISWQKNATDELIITYVYSEETQVTSIASNIKAIIKIHKNDNEVQKEYSLKLETIEEKGNIVKLQASIDENIYKGNMYLNQDTKYQTKYDIFVSYANEKNICVIDSGDTANSENLATYYKKTLINKAQAINVLGNEGTIKIYNGADTKEPISEIVLSQENDKEYFEVEYSADINNIVIETSAPKKEGTIEIVNEKIVKVVKLEKIEEATKIDVSANLVVTNAENKSIENVTETKVANLLEPKTSIDLVLDKQTISNQVENELTLTAILNTNNNSNKLLENPTINIELPKEITEATLVEDINLLYEDELKIASSGIITNDNGNKVIRIVLEGKQTKYDTSANIVMKLKVKANPVMEDKEAEIKTTCIMSDIEEANVSDKITISSKKGIITKNSITIGESKVENTNNILTNTTKDNSEIKINSVIINNNGEKITNSVLTGSVPEGTNLKEQVQINLNNATISYSTKENPTAEEWVNTVEDYSTIKVFKIDIEELEQASSFEILYTLIPTENGLKEKDSFVSNVNLKYVIKEQTKEEKIEFKVTNLAKGQLIDVVQNNNIVMSLKSKTSTETLHEGQIVTYELAVTNTGSEALNNTVLSYTVPEGAVYTELTYAQASNITYTDNAELRNKEWNIESLKPNETIAKEVTIKINQGTEQIVSNALLKNAEGTVLVEAATKTVQVNKSDISVRLSTRDNFLTESNEGDTIEYKVIVENISDKAINDLQVIAKIPQNTTFTENNEGWEYNKENNTISSNIKTIEPKVENSEEKNNIVILSFKVEVNKFDNNVIATTIQNSAIIKDSNFKEYETNVYTTKVTTTRWQINQKAEHNNTLKEGEQVKYIIEVKNIGGRADYTNVKDSVPEEIQLQKTKIYIDETLIEEQDVFSSNELEVNQKLEVGQTLKIEIEGITYDLGSGVKSKEIKNIPYIDLGEGNYLNSQEIINIIENDEQEDPEKIETEQPDDPEQPENPENSEVYSISGLAWIDKNQNGIRDNNEQVLNGIEVTLLNQNGDILKDSEGKELKTITTITGTYKFNNIKNGEYMVIFSYDTNKYVVTKYQTKDGTEEENSDVISKEISINNQNILVAVTDIIKVKDTDIKNIDIGLVQKEKFDLSLEKYVEKVILTNSEESTTYSFNQSTLAKISIDAKKLAKSSILVQYKIKIYNNGDVNAYVNDVIDYIPKELTFNSEMNPDWYLDSEGALHNQTLEKEQIGPEESKTVSLVLTKVLNNNSTGTIDNLAEIGESTNLEGIKEMDSIAGNKKAGEDDISSASLIISIKTGGPALYMGIVIISLIVLGLGIYLINKKVLKGGF